MHSLDYNCAVLANQIYSDETPGPWFKRIQRNLVTNSFVPKSSIFKRKNTIWIVFGGSSRTQDFVADANFSTCEPFDTMHCGLRVHAGMWTNLKDLMQSRIAPCLATNIATCTEVTNCVETIIITGHSLGGAYATLARFFLEFSPTIEQSTFRGIQFHVVTFGAPLVFAHASGRHTHAADAVESISRDIRNYVNGSDFAPRLLGKKFRDWRPFVKNGFKGGRGLGAGLAAAGAVLLNSGTGGMAFSAAVLGSGFYAYYTAQKFGGTKAMAAAQLLSAPKLRERWLAMLESDEAKMYFTVGEFILLSHAERAVRLEASDRKAATRMLDVPEGYDAFAKSIKHHQMEEYLQLLNLTLPFQ